MSSSTNVGMAFDRHLVVIVAPFQVKSLVEAIFRFFVCQCHLAPMNPKRHSPVLFA